MKLLIEPQDGIQSLIQGIGNAKRKVEIVIFRFDHREVERALTNAVSRGVSVHALIAHTNRAGERNLRNLEMRLLAGGVTVARTADDLIRYHGKMMIVDRRELYLLGFNFTYLDIERSRSFGLITRSADRVQEAVRLFEADVKRHPYEPQSDGLVVSPINSRKLLAEFIQSAKKELVIYDPKVSDPGMASLLQERAEAGVDIRLIGRTSRRIPGMQVHKLAPLRLHTRTMIRDRHVAFCGSQSLRAIELDARREVGMIIRDKKVVSGILRTFEEDWVLAEQAASHVEEETPSTRVAKKVAKAVAKELPLVAPVLNGVVKEIVGDVGEVDLDPEEVQAAIKGAVKQAVKEVVSGMVEAVVEENGGEAQ